MDPGLPRPRHDHVLCAGLRGGLVQAYEHSRGALIETCRTAVPPFRVDFAKHAEAMGAVGIRVASMGELDEAIKRAQAAERTTVIHVDVHPTDWSGNDNSWWECGTPEVSPRETVAKARKDHEAGKKRQRLGV